MFNDQRTHDHPASCAIVHPTSAVPVAVLELPTLAAYWRWRQPQLARDVYSLQSPICANAQEWLGFLEGEFVLDPELACLTAPETRAVSSDTTSQAFEVISGARWALETANHDVGSAVRLMCRAQDEYSQLYHQLGYLGQDADDCELAFGTLPTTRALEGGIGHCVPSRAAVIWAYFEKRKDGVTRPPQRPSAKTSKRAAKPSQTLVAAFIAWIEEAKQGERLDLRAPGLLVPIYSLEDEVGAKLLNWLTSYDMQVMEDTAITSLQFADAEVYGADHLDVLTGIFAQRFEEFRLRKSTTCRVNPDCNFLAYQALPLPRSVLDVAAAIAQVESLPVFGAPPWFMYESPSLARERVLLACEVALVPQLERDPEAVLALFARNSFWLNLVIVNVVLQHGTPIVVARALELLNCSHAKWFARFSLQAYNRFHLLLVRNPQWQKVIAESVHKSLEAKAVPFASMALAHASNDKAFTQRVFRAVAQRLDNAFSLFELLSASELIRSQIKEPASFTALRKQMVTLPLTDDLSEMSLFVLLSLYHQEWANLYRAGSADAHIEAVVTRYLQVVRNEEELNELEPELRKMTRLTDVPKLIVAAYQRIDRLACDRADKANMIGPILLQLLRLPCSKADSISGRVPNLRTRCEAWIARQPLELQAEFQNAVAKSLPKVNNDAVKDWRLARPKSRAKRVSKKTPAAAD